MPRETGVWTRQRRGDALVKLSRSKYRLRETSWAAISQGRKVNLTLVRSAKQTRISLYHSVDDRRPQTPELGTNLRTADSLQTCRYKSSAYMSHVSAGKTVCELKEAKRVSRRVYGTLFCSINCRQSASSLNYEIGTEQELSDTSYPGNVLLLCASAK